MPVVEPAAGLPDELGQPAGKRYVFVWTCPANWKTTFTMLFSLVFGWVTAFDFAFTRLLSTWTVKGLRQLEHCLDPLLLHVLCTFLPLGSIALDIV